MIQEKDGRKWWSELDAMRGPMMTRIERYAALTIPSILFPEGFTQYNTEQGTDYQSLGAMGVNHVNNKLLLALAPPSRPSFRLEPTADFKKQLLASGVQEADLVRDLAVAERTATKRFDGLGQRPKLYQMGRHLIVTGNVLVIFGEKNLRVMGLRYWCVKRDVMGRIRTLVIKESVCFDELDPEVQTTLGEKYASKGSGKVELYKIIERQPNGDYTLRTWVDDVKLPEAFDGKWAEADCPYRVMTWNLADEDDYGVGLIEELIGDLEAVSTLSENVNDSSILATEVRWAVNPSSGTTATEFAESQNGDAIAARKEDVAPITAGNLSAVQAADGILARKEQRLARAFLLASAMTRDAERVTAEEIRATARELETAYGGVYSSLAVQFQKPLADWLLKEADLSIKGTQFEVTIITGLEALSRGADLDNFAAAIQYMVGFENLPDSFKQTFDPRKVAAYVGAGTGCDLTALMLSESEIAQQQENQAAARVAESTATAAGEAAAQGPQ